MPKFVKWMLWAAAALVLYRVISSNPGGAGHGIHQFLASVWTFLGSI